jgi:hypothetical protein
MFRLIVKIQSMLAKRTKEEKVMLFIALICSAMIIDNQKNYMSFISEVLR